MCEMIILLCIIAVTIIHYAYTVHYKLNSSNTLLYNYITTCIHYFIVYNNKLCALAIQYKYAKYNMHYNLNYEFNFLKKIN